MEKYNYITNPITKEKILLNSEHGQIILDTYAKQYGGADGQSPTLTTEEIESINNFLKTIDFVEIPRQNLQSKLNDLGISEIPEVQKMLQYVLL